MKTLFFLFIAKPLSFFFLGLNIHGRKKLPKKGPAVLIANHNSHLDVFVLMSLFPIQMVRKIHPVAARDYFLKTKFLSWFSRKIVGIIPFKREITKGEHSDPFKEIKDCLEKEEIVIIFPEGTRGEAEKLAQVKSGIARLAVDLKDVPIIPVIMKGLGRSLPKGDPIFVPFNVSISIGDVLEPKESRCEFMNNLKVVFEDLFQKTHLGTLEDL